MPYNTNSMTLCSACSVQQGSISCEGCGKKYCYRCLTEHREALINELEYLTNQRNQIKEEFDRSRSNNSSSVAQIDQWARDMHAKVDQVAQKAKEQVQRLLSKSTDDIRQKLDRVSEEIQQRQKSKDVIDTNIETLRKDLNDLEKAIQQINPKILIDTSNAQRIQWDSLIAVTTAKTSGSNFREESQAKETYSRKPGPVVYDQGPKNQGRVQSAANVPSRLPNWHSKEYLENRFDRQPPPSQQQQQQITPSTPKPRQNTSYSTNSKKSLRQYQCICCKTMNSFYENEANQCSICKSPYNF